MPKHIYRDDVRRMANEGAQIVDVLPRDEYEESHLPGAINIPLKELSRETAAQLRRDIPTCSPAEKVGAARERVRKAKQDRCVVVNEERVVLGLLREKELAANPETTAEEAMRNGPVTFRPDVPVEKMAERMRERGASAVLVSTSEGRLLGLLYREDAERLSAE